MTATPTRSADVIVVGLGAMGSATCFQLATAGATVIGIDRHHPPHPFGSTHGETRITRLAIGEGPEYAPLVRRAHELWPEIEAAAGVQLFTRCGGLVLAPAGPGFLDQTRACAREYGIEHENLSAADLAERFPMFAAGEGTEGYYEPSAGYVRPEAAVQAQLDLAGTRGADLHFGERVTGWTATGAGVEVATTSGRYTAGALVLSAGPWISELWPGARERFIVYRQLMYWFPIRRGYEQLRQMPVFIWELAGVKPGHVHLLGFYGMPAVDGPDGGLKVASETYEHPTAPDDQQHPASPAEAQDTFTRYVGPHLPWLGAPPLRSASCLYTSTAENRFVIDRHPEHGNVLIVSPCSGHGFKHSPAIGEAVAQLVTRGASDLNLAGFAL